MRESKLPNPQENPLARSEEFSFQYERTHVAKWRKPQATECQNVCVQYMPMFLDRSTMFREKWRKISQLWRGNVKREQWLWILRWVERRKFSILWCKGSEPGTPRIKGNWFKWKDGFKKKEKKGDGYVSQCSLVYFGHPLSVVPQS